MSLFDLSRHNEINDWLKSLSSGEPFNGMVHCAGISKTLPVQSISPVDFDNVLSINTTAAFSLVRAFRQRNVHATRSSIVLLGSIIGMRGKAGLSAYGASKAAILGLTNSFAIELAGAGIRVNCISPGFVDTEMTRKEWATLSSEQIAKIEATHPLGVGTPDDIGYAAMFLLSDAAKWITGSNMIVDGGASSSF
jgi:NAD(P)-dependent dehydrogenase (short-subunit alcohol dehydrogenase family)